MGSNSRHMGFKPCNCANCGKKESATMGVMVNGGFAYVCSSACEKRMHKRIENGMLKTEDIIQTSMPFDPFNIPPDDPRIGAMRIRIKQLEHGIK
jgi:hypothetical protein